MAPSVREPGPPPGSKAKGRAGGRDSTQPEPGAKPTPSADSVKPEKAAKGEGDSSESKGPAGKPAGGKAEGGKPKPKAGAGDGRGEAWREAGQATMPAEGEWRAEMPVLVGGEPGAQPAGGQTIEVAVEVTEDLVMEADEEVGMPAGTSALAPPTQRWMAAEAAACFEAGHPPAGPFVFGGKVHPETQKRILDGGGVFYGEHAPVGMLAACKARALFNPRSANLQRMLKQVAEDWVRQHAVEASPLLTVDWVCQAVRYGMEVGHGEVKTWKRLRAKRPNRQMMRASQWYSGGNAGPESAWTRVDDFLTGPIFANRSRLWGQAPPR